MSESGRSEVVETIGLALVRLGGNWEKLIEENQKIPVEHLPPKPEPDFSIYMGELKNSERSAEGLRWLFQLVCLRQDKALRFNNHNPCARVYLSYSYNLKAGTLEPAVNYSGFNDPPTECHLCVNDPKRCICQKFLDGKAPINNQLEMGALCL